MIIFSDVHLREDSEETVFGQVLPGIFEAAKQHGKTRGYYEVACLGDVFHFRYEVEARLQNMLYDVLREWSDAGFHVRILPGNHDQYDLEGRNCLELYDEINHVDVYTHACADGDGLWIPYRKDPKYIEWAVQKFGGNAMNLEGNRVCFLHNGITGALMNDRYKNEIEGVPVDAFGGFHAVICGHYHKRQSVGHAHYVGSPYQTRADESGQAKGYAVWDGVDLEYADTSWGKRYHRLDIDSADDLDVSEFEEGDDVRIKTASGVDPSSVARKLIEAGVQNHTVTPDVEPSQTRLDVPENADLHAYATAYVEAQETHLDKTKLMNFFTTLRERLAGV